MQAATELDTNGPDNEICELAAEVHAGTARLAAMVARYDSSEAWAEAGMRSCAHWLTVAAGFDLRSSNELLRVGHALKDLPLIAAAFNEGRLSFDKVRAITRVATRDDDAFSSHFIPQGRS